MSAVDADEKIDAWKLEYLDFEPPCSLADVECDQPAVCHLQMRCCGAVIASLCADHHRCLAAEFLLSDTLRYTWRCAVCAVRGRVGDITRFVPIGARS